MLSYRLDCKQQHMRLALYVRVVNRQVNNKSIVKIISSICFDLLPLEALCSSTFTVKTTIAGCFVLRGSGLVLCQITVSIKTISVSCSLSR